ncbi:MAG: hypothetical protein POELPBGB_02966 [Bacteroidia bacterium]|nr:hypothetical protein [Bacteroidia bacterium]
MPIPSHDYSCLTKAFPTECQHCKHRVYFFSCNCGSKLFFDHLGPPWPIHYCEARKVTDTLKMMQGIERMSDDEIYYLITKYEKQHKVHISEEMLEIVENVLGKRKYKFQTVAVEPNEDIRDISGMIMSFDREINLFKKYDYVPGIFGDAFLGELAKEKFGQIVVREKEDKNNVSKEYRVLIQQSYYRRYPLKQNDFILGEVRVYEHPKGKEFILMQHKVY